MSAVGRGRGWAWLCLGLTGAVLATAISAIEASHRCRQFYARLQDLQSEQWNMQEQWGRLLLEQSTWANHYRVEQLALKELGMHLPDATELVVVAP